MRRILLLISLVFLLHIFTFGQNYVLVNTFGSTGVSVSDNLIGNGSAFHRLTWNVSGTVTGCTVALDSSVDGNSWSAGGVIAGQTCTSNGTILSASSVVNYVRINMTAFVGTGTVTVIDQGYVNNPGAGGGAVTSCGPGNAVYTANGTTVTCDPLITDTSLNGTLNFAQGSLGASAPFNSHTATWNAGAVVFNNWITNITCTAAAAASKLFDYQVASASQVSVSFAAANCAGPRFNFPDGSATQASIGFGSDAAGLGAYKNASNDWVWTNGTTPFFRIKAGVELGTAGCYQFSSTSSAIGTVDTGIDRSGIGVVRFDGNSGCNDGTAKLKAAGYIAVGTTFTGNAGCSETTLTGGATAGKFTAVSTSCTIIITMGNSATAVNGWSCTAIDLTTLADVVNPHQTATTITTATIVTGTIVSGDVIQFSCIGY